MGKVCPAEVEAQNKLVLPTAALQLHYTEHSSPGTFRDAEVSTPRYYVLLDLAIVPVSRSTKRKDKPPTLRFSVLLTEDGAERLELVKA